MRKAQPQAPRLARNWAIWVGSILVLIVIIIAIFGPLFAPKDPMEQSFVVEYREKFLRPPFPPGAPGYPLGSDEVGRDVLSRLFYAVRPTLMLVIVVAAVRMILGILIGMGSGWSSGRVGRLLDTLISGALAIPVLFVALCIIAALANRWGVWAFILGLCVTGWAESARLVHEHTRAVKAQPFVEATRALGATSGQLILSHVIPHIMPLMWIQMAFEISAALLTTAALGFLGYFVNAVWVPTDFDFVALRASGMPELGQMLGIAANGQPWTAVFAGTLVFFIVLAFNILGEGLRFTLNPERQRRRAERTEGVVNQASNWLEERVYFAVTEWRRTAATGAVFGGLFLVVIAGAWWLWQAQGNQQARSAIEVPGGHAWAAELHDAQGTYWSAAKGPAEPSVAWTYTGEGSVVGGPVVDRGGNLYLNYSDSRLVILHPDGSERSVVKLPAAPVGFPALGLDDTVFVVDETGNLRCFTQNGELLWVYTSDPQDPASVSPIVGPGGMVYYPTQSFLIAVSPQGERVWQIRLPSYSYTSPLPRLSADGKYLFFEDVVVDAETGVTLFKETPAMMDRYVVGADGLVYLRSPETFMEWQPSEDGAVLLQRAKLDASVLATNMRAPFDSGVSPSHNPWLLYSSGFENPRMVWTDPKGQSPQIFDFPYLVERFIGIDANSVSYMCGVAGQRGQVGCRAVQLSTGLTVWKTELDMEAIPVVGGALAEGRLYIALANGQVVAFGEATERLMEQEPAALSTQAQISFYPYLARNR